MPIGPVEQDIEGDPLDSSSPDPTSGRIQYSRMGPELVPEWGQSLDRRFGAGIELLQTAGSKGLAGGLRFSPGAFQHDVMMTLYDPVTGARSEPNGTSRKGGGHHQPPDL